MFAFQVVFFRCFCKCFRHKFKFSSVFTLILQVLYLDVSKVDWVLHLPPHLGVSSSSIALHPSQIAEEARRGLGDGSTDKRALSPSLLHGQGRDTTPLICYCEQPEIELM
jgi:hypothetical protein